MTEKKQKGPFGGLSASEAARRSAESRASKAEGRRAEAADNALTFRQRLGVSLSKLTQSELDKRVKEAKPTELVRFADQAFGRPQDAEADSPIDPELAALTREQRALLREWLMQRADTEAQEEDQRSEDDAIATGMRPPPDVAWGVTLPRTGSRVLGVPRGCERDTEYFRAYRAWNEECSRLRAVDEDEPAAEAGG